MLLQKIDKLVLDAGKTLYVALQGVCHTTSLLDSTFALAVAAVVERDSDCAVQEGSLP